MKKIIKLIIIIVIFVLLSITIVYASIQFDSNYVYFNNVSSGTTSTNLKEAIDELDVLLTPVTNCPSKTMTCKKNTPICKRVTSSSSLHTTTCQQSSNNCAAVEGNGNTITYGKAKSLGTPLEPGDAFDCKVSTTGGYSERFYYVSDYYDTSTKSFNSDVGVLIYYSNTLNGSASNKGAAYDSSNGSNNYGPVTAVTHLPETTQWNNISLYKRKRNILGDKNETTISGIFPPITFDYRGRAARLLTYQEVYDACYNTPTGITSTGGLNNCNFLFENTEYSSSGLDTAGIWLDTIRTNTSNCMQFLYSSSRDVFYYTVSSSYQAGVRPVIEILKSDISY